MDDIIDESINCTVTTVTAEQASDNRIPLVCPWKTYENMTIGHAVNFFIDEGIFSKTFDFRKKKKYTLKDIFEKDGLKKFQAAVCKELKDLELMDSVAEILKDA
jgi:hypothetical protein